MTSPIVPLRKSTRRSIAVLPSQIGSFSPITKRKSVTPGPSTDLLRRQALTTTPLILSQEPRQEQKGPTKPKYANPIMEKIKRDLNSPSATARIRANKALKSPTFCAQTYCIFDVPHELQDLITEEERAPIKQKTIEEIFANVKVYVEVRTGDDNRSEGVKAQLLRQGITVNQKLYKDTTHVIFKDGLLSTYKNALKQGCAVTSVLWFEACMNQKRLVDPAKFKISNLDRYERPELYKRIRRPKAMQPDSFVFKYKVPQVAIKTVQETLKESPQKETPAAECSDSKMELTLQGEKTLIATPEPILVEEDQSELETFRRGNHRLTTFTPNPMEQTGKLDVGRRKSLFTPCSTQNSDSSTPVGNGFSANSSNTIVFNSSKLPKNPRRSVFDISMNILEMNVKAMSQKKENEEDCTETKTETSAGLIIQNTQTKPGTTVRKRKLFTNESFVDEIEESKENLSKSHKKTDKRSKLDKSLPAVLSTLQVKKKQKMTVNSRRTLDFFKPQKPKTIAATKQKTPVKQILQQKFIVVTNMSSTEKCVIHTAIEKLGGQIENEVTSRTTHVVSPNIDRTMNVLRGVIRACLIINPKWIHDSIENNKWLETSPYQFDIVDSHRVYERSILGTKNYQNLTFANQGLFYLNRDSIDNLKKIEYIKEIVALCNGAFTENKAAARFIVSDQPATAYNSKQDVVITTFVFDSAMKGKCLEASRYAPKESSKP